MDKGHTVWSNRNVGNFNTILFQVTVACKMDRSLARQQSLCLADKDPGDFNATLLLQLLSLSAVRFGVFIVQYYLLFRLFDVHILWWQAFWTISVSFLVLAIIPTIAIIELFQRRMIVKTIVGLYSTNELGITLTTAGIWFINLIVPAIIGSLLILSIKKIFGNKEEMKT